MRGASSVEKRATDAKGGNARRVRGRAPSASGRRARPRAAGSAAAGRARTRAEGEVASGAAPGRRPRAKSAHPAAARPSALVETDVREHLPLVRQVVQRMLPRKPPEVSTEDLLAWGVVGLLDAMRKYDPGREATFSTYAQYRIRGSVLDYLRRCDWVPRSIRQKSHDLEEAAVRLERRLGRQPEGAEIAAECEMSPAEYSQVLAALGATTLIPTGDLGFGRGEESLTEDEALSDDAENGPMKRVLRKERVEILAGAIEQLPEKERIIVSFYYFEGLTMREMAAALGLTEGRISQLHSQAMARLRGALGPTREEIAID